MCAMVWTAMTLLAQPLPTQEMMMHQKSPYPIDQNSHAAAHATYELPPPCPPPPKTLLLSNCCLVSHTLHELHSPKLKASRHKPSSSSSNMANVKHFLKCILNTDLKSVFAAIWQKDEVQKSRAAVVH